MKRNSTNTDIDINADGFTIGGGTTPRKLTLSGADVAIVGSGSNEYTFPASSGTLALTTDIPTGTSGLVSNEVPGGLINGSNTAFTTTSAFATGSLKVFKNGIRLKAGGADFTEGASGFTMVTAPATGTVLLVDYTTVDSATVVGSTSFIYSELCGGTPNGVLTAFTTASSYVANSTCVFLDGVRMRRGVDYTESADKQITFTTAPATGSEILIDYQSAVSATGNADTIDGLHASAFWPVGSIYISVVSTNPATLFGFGTWVAFGAGKTMVGLDSGDTDFDTAEETGGSKTHTLAITEIPSHAHRLRRPSGNLAASGTAVGGEFVLDYEAAGNISGNVEPLGGGGAHNNLQPYIVTYFWKRTA